MSKQHDSADCEYTPAGIPAGSTLTQKYTSKCYEYEQRSWSILPGKAAGKGAKRQRFEVNAGWSVE